MLNILQYGVPIGDWPDMNAVGSKKMGANSHTQYIGGCAVGLATDGLVVGGQTNQCESVAADISGGVSGASNFLGLMVNNYLLDIRTGLGVRGGTTITDALPTIVLAPCLVELKKGTRDDVADATPPFLTTVAWARRDRLYTVDSATAADNGLWTNVASGTNTMPLGVVIKPPVDENDSMIAYFWAIPDLYTQA